MTTGAVHARDQDVGARCDRYTVILVIHCDIAEGYCIRAGDVKGVRIVPGSTTTAEAIGRVPCRVIESQTGHGQTLGAFDVKQMGWPVLDIQVLDHGILDVLDDEEVVGLADATV